MARFHIRLDLFHDLFINSWFAMNQNSIKRSKKHNISHGNIEKNFKKIFCNLNLDRKKENSI